jgi:hypothetical protein
MKRTQLGVVDSTPPNHKRSKISTSPLSPASRPFEPLSPTPSSVSSNVRSRSLLSPSSVSSPPLRGFVSSYGIAAIIQFNTVHIWNTRLRNPVTTVLEVPTLGRNSTQTPIVAIFDMQNYYAASQQPVNESSDHHHIAVLAITPEGSVRYWPWINANENGPIQSNDYRMRTAEANQVTDIEYFTKYAIDEESNSVYVSSDDSTEIACLTIIPSKHSVEVKKIHDSTSSRNNGSSILDWFKWSKTEKQREFTRSIAVTKSSNQRQTDILILTDQYLKRTHKKYLQNYQWQWEAKKEINQYLSRLTNANHEVWLLDMTTDTRDELSCIYILAAYAPAFPHPDGVVPLVNYIVFQIATSESGAQIDNAVPLSYNHDYVEYSENAFIENSKIYFSVFGSTTVLYVLWKDRYMYLVYQATEAEWQPIEQPILISEEVIGAGVFRQYRDSPLCLVTSKSGVLITKIQQPELQEQIEILQEPSIQLKVDNAVGEVKSEHFIKLLKQSLNKEINPENLRLFVSPATILYVSNAIIDARNSSTQWSKQYGSEEAPTLLISNQLDTKWKKYAEFYRILMTTENHAGNKLWNTLSKYEQEIVIQNGEYLKIALHLRRIQEFGAENLKSNQRLSDALKRCCSMRGLPNESCTPEHFYTGVSKVFKIFDVLLDMERSSDLRQQTYADIVCTNLAFIAIVNGIQEHIEFMEQEYALDTSHGAHAINDVCPLLFDQLEVIFAFVNGGGAENDQEIVLLSQTLIIADFYLFVYDRDSTDQEVSKSVAETRKKIIEFFMSRALSDKSSPSVIESAKQKSLTFAEKHHDYSMLIQLCYRFFESPHRESRIEEYLVHFQDTAFPIILFQYLVTRGKYMEVLSNESPYQEQYKDQIKQVITGRPLFEYMHGVQHNIADALKPIAELALNPKLTLNEKTTNVSLLKLTSYCATYDRSVSAEIVDEYSKIADQSQLLVESQRFLQDKLALLPTEHVTKTTMPKDFFKLVDDICDSVITVPIEEYIRRNKAIRDESEDDIRNELEIKLYDRVRLGLEVYDKRTKATHESLPDVLNKLWLAAWCASVDLNDYIQNMDSDEYRDSNDAEDVIRNSAIHRLMIGTAHSRSSITIELYQQLETSIVSLHQRNYNLENVRRVLIDLWSFYQNSLRELETALNSSYIDEDEMDDHVPA